MILELYSNTHTNLASKKTCLLNFDSCRYTFIKRIYLSANRELADAH